jgi:cardiolipin synthase A/B
MTLYYWTAFHLVSSWVIRLTVLPVIVLRKEKPATCLAWLAVIFFEPWLGLLLYLLIGEVRFGRRRLEKRQVERAEFHAVERPAVEPHYMVQPGEPDHPPLLVHVPEHFGSLPVVSGNRVVFLSEAEATIDRLLAEIDAAKHHVHLLFYIFADDEIGRRVGDSLIRAAERGVTCRLLADSVGSRHMFRRLARRLAAGGVQVHPVLPVNLLRIPFSRLDVRNHRKLAVIDGRTAFVGSKNIVQPSFGHRRAGSWIDIMAGVTGPVVRQLQQAFLEDWYYESGELPDDAALYPPLGAEGPVAVQVVPTGPGLPTEQFQDVIVKSIFLARQRVVITSPYFVPDESMLLALRLATRRGVQVDVVIPKRSNHPVADAAGWYYCDRLMREGTNVYLYQPGMLHSKTLSVDDQLAMIGSGNYDIRSFELNFELNLLLHGHEAVSEMRAIQDGYIAESIRATLDQWPTRTLGGRLKVNLAKLFSPLL